MYSLDANFFIGGWTRTYDPAVFPSMWEQLQLKISEHSLFASEEVLKEVKYPDDLVEWIKNCNDLCVETDSEIIESVGTIVNQFYGGHDRFFQSTKNHADPFVIAAAEVKNGVVVCDEKFGGKGAMKVPNVCKAMGIECISTMELLRRVKVRV